PPPLSHDGRGAARAPPMAPRETPSPAAERRGSRPDRLARRAAGDGTAAGAVRRRCVDRRGGRPPPVVGPAGRFPGPRSPRRDRGARGPPPVPARRRRGERLDADPRKTEGGPKE